MHNSADVEPDGFSLPSPHRASVPTVAPVSARKAKEPWRGTATIKATVASIMAADELSRFHAQAAAVSASLS